MSSTAAWKAASFAMDGLLKPLTFRTNCSDAARISSSEEDPLPVERFRQDPAEEHADAPSSGGDEAKDAHRLRPVGRLGEQVHNQRWSLPFSSWMMLPPSTTMDWPVT